MKHKKPLLVLIGILMLLFQFTMQAQVWAPVGATWHYTQETINPNLISYKTIESLSDTTINGIQCKKMIEVERYIDTVDVVYHYVYSENDSVFFYAANNFQLLYDFGALPGDTIILDYFITFNGSPLKMIIDSLGSININNENRIVQHITCGDGIVVEFGKHVIVGIGSTSFMFPTYDLSINGPLRCYEDSTLGLFINPFYPNSTWNHQDCDQIITGIEEFESYDEIVAFPNPFNQTLNFHFNKCNLNFANRLQFKLYDSMGSIVKIGIIPKSKSINLSKLNSGFYNIHFLLNNKIIHKQKIIKL